VPGRKSTNQHHDESTRLAVTFSTAFA